MITDEDKCFVRGEYDEEQWVFQHVDGRFYIEAEHSDFENCGLCWDDEHEVHFMTYDRNMLSFLKSLNFEEYEPFCG